MSSLPAGLMGWAREEAKVRPVANDAIVTLARDVAFKMRDRRGGTWPQLYEVTSVLTVALDIAAAGNIPAAEALLQFDWLNPSDSGTAPADELRGKSGLTIEEAEDLLGECFRIAGGDCDGNENWRPR